MGETPEIPEDPPIEQTDVVTVLLECRRGANVSPFLEPRHFAPERRRTGNVLLVVLTQSMKKVVTYLPRDIAVTTHLGTVVPSWLKTIVVGETRYVDSNRLSVAMGMCSESNMKLYPRRISLPSVASSREDV